MEHSYKVIGRTLVYEMAGELDHKSSTQLRRNMDRIIEKGGITNLIMDMKDVTLMDSSGLGLIMGRYRVLRQKGGTLKVVNAGRAVKRVLALAGIDKLVM